MLGFQVMGSSFAKLLPIAAAIGVAASPQGLSAQSTTIPSFVLVDAGAENDAVREAPEFRTIETSSEQEDAPAKAGSLQAPDRDFTLILAPYVWIPNVTGDIGLGAQGIPLDLDAGDLLDVFDFGGLIRAEIRHKSGWGLSVDHIFADLGAGVDIVIGDVGADIDAGITEVAISRRFENGADAFDVYAGVRHWNADLDVAVDTFLISTNIVTGDEWTDPIVGVRYLHPVSRRWRLITQADIGGFGAGSEFTWNAVAGVSYAASDSAQFQVVYRSLNVDRQGPPIGAGSSPVDLDLTIQGPLIGFAFRF